MPVLTFENVMLIDAAEEAIYDMKCDVELGCAPALAAARAQDKIRQLLSLESFEELRYVIEEKLVRIRAALVLAHKYYGRPTVIKSIGEEAALRLRNDYADLLATMSSN